MKRLRVFDGCTEFGSETQAFRDRGHEVVTLGMEGDVDIKCDIRQFHTDEHYDFMILHPPCTEFSLANYRLGACKNRNPDMSIVDACFRLVRESMPDYWLIENPKGCLRYFIGKPAYEIKYSDYGFPSMKPTDLWGYIPMFSFIAPNDEYKPWKESIPRDPKKRAIVPYFLGLSICKAIEGTYA